MKKIPLTINKENISGQIDIILTMQEIGTSREYAGPYHNLVREHTITEPQTVYYQSKITVKGGPLTRFRYWYGTLMGHLFDDISDLARTIVKISLVAALVIMIASTVTTLSTGMSTLLLGVSAAMVVIGTLTLVSRLLLYIDSKITNTKTLNQGSLDVSLVFSNTEQIPPNEDTLVDIDLHSGSQDKIQWSLIYSTACLVKFVHYLQQHNIQFQLEINMNNLQPDEFRRRCGNHYIANTYLINRLTNLHKFFDDGQEWFALLANHYTQKLSATLWVHPNDQMFLMMSN